MLPPDAIFKFKIRQNCVCGQGPTGGAYGAPPDCIAAFQGAAL